MPQTFGEQHCEPEHRKERQVAAQPLAKSWIVSTTRQVAIEKRQQSLWTEQVLLVRMVQQVRQFTSRIAQSSVFPIDQANSCMGTSDDVREPRIGLTEAQRATSRMSGKSSCKPRSSASRHLSAASLR
jgi:hypothetical protein